MDMNRTSRLVALGAALLLGGASLATAQPPARARAGQVARAQRARQPQGGRRQLRRALFRGIDLSVAQRRQIRDVSLKYADQREDLVLALRKKAGAAQGERPDSATRARLRGELQSQNRALMEKQIADLRGVLTADQRAAFDRNVAQLRERMKTRAARADSLRARRGRVPAAFGARGFGPRARRLPE